MSQSSGTITKLFKSRQILLDLLKKQGFDTGDYEEFSVNEVHTMSNNEQMDMLISTPEGSSDPKKTYVKYLCLSLAI